MSVFAPEKLKELQEFTATLGETQAIMLTVEQLGMAAAGRCPLYQVYTDSDGRFVLHIWRCRRPLYCEYCRTIRARELEERMNEISATSSVAIQLVSGSEEAKALHRALGADNYYCLPNADGTETLIVNSYYSDKLAGYATVAVDSNYLQQMDYMALAQTPNGKRITGGLGKKPLATGSAQPVQEIEEKEVPNKPYDFTAKVAFVSSNAGKDVDQAAMLDAIRLTSDAKDVPDMTSPDSVHQALNRRTAMYTELLRASGYKVSTEWKIITIHVVPTLGWLTWTDGMQWKDCIRTSAQWQDKYKQDTKAEAV